MLAVQKGCTNTQRVGTYSSRLLLCFFLFFATTEYNSICKYTLYSKTNTSKKNCYWTVGSLKNNPDVTENVGLKHRLAKEHVTLAFDQH